MMTVKFDTTALQTKAKFDAATSSFRIAAIIQARAQKAAKILLSAIRGRTDRFKRSGKLSEAVYTTVKSTNTGLEVVGGVNLRLAPYARVQELGGVIRPKNGKFLTIPVGPNRDGRGVMLFSARQFIANPGVLGFVGSFVNRAKTAILGTRADGTFEPVFALKTSVRLKKVGYMQAARRDVNASVRDEIRGIAADLKKGVES